MKNFLAFLGVIIAFSACKPMKESVTEVVPENKPKYVIVIHGGAGNITPDNLSGEEREAYRDALHKALGLGKEMLEEGSTAVEVVEAVIMVMEDSPLFNAGKGSVFTNDGKNEMDASIMDGKTLNAGAVAGVTTIQNPISAALEVMTGSDHVMLSGRGAEKFAAEKGLKIVEPAYFYTKERFDLYQRIKGNEKHGTVGCVVLDMYGNLCAGTSTGGMTNKKWNRIGDSPIIGAGTYANNKTCAVSCTGHGEYFIRNVVAYDVSAKMEYQGKTLAEASEEIIMHKLKEQEGSGGLIAVDKNGNVSMVFNTKGMFRAYYISQSPMDKQEVLMFGD